MVSRRYPDPHLHAVIVAGGAGERLGGVCKADLELGGRRLLDLVLTDLHAVVGGRIVVVAPDPVAVPDGVIRTLEDPPGGGPLDGIGAGLAALGAGGVDARVLVCAVDSPGIRFVVARLAQALAAEPGRDGVVAFGGEPVPFRQYLQAIYRWDALAGALAEAGGLRHRGVTRTLRVLDLIEVPVDADDCRDLDTPEDLAWWVGRVQAAAGTGQARRVD